MWYNYIYLNPEKPGKFIYNDIVLDFEPFYVGKGTGNRYLSHIYNKTNVNEYKNHKINKILKNISKKEYIEKFIYVFNHLC